MEELNARINIAEVPNTLWGKIQRDGDGRDVKLWPEAWARGCMLDAIYVISVVIKTDIVTTFERLKKHGIAKKISDKVFRIRKYTKVVEFTYMKQK